MKSELSELELIEVKRYAKEKLGLCRKGNDIIGTQIFSILRIYGRVIYYPLGLDAPWGFTRISGSKNDTFSKKPFVAINSSIPIDCQVFAAAHELYHIWYEHIPNVLPSDLLNEKDKKIREKKANRFAAEFLVDEILLKQEIEIYNIKRFSLKNVLKLSELFVVPYKTMVKRLYEIKAINEEEFEVLVDVSEDDLEIGKKKYSISSYKQDEKIVLDNLVELAVNAYEAGYIAYEKLEYLLELSKLKPIELGIKEKEKIEFPADEELDSIMEE